MRFIRYIIQYFTHWNIISIGKKSDLIKQGKWYRCHYFFKCDGDNVSVANVSISERESL